MGFLNHQQYDQIDQKKTHTPRKINMEPENTPLEFRKIIFPVPSCSGSIRQSSGVQTMKKTLVGGFNPVEKQKSNWIISPGKGENKKYLKPPPRTSLHDFFGKNFHHPETMDSKLPRTPHPPRYCEN